MSEIWVIHIELELRMGVKVKGNQKYPSGDAINITRKEKEKIFFACPKSIILVRSEATQKERIN